MKFRRRQRTEEDGASASSRVSLGAGIVFRRGARGRNIVRVKPSSRPGEKNERVIIEGKGPVKEAEGSQNADVLSDESEPADTDPRQRGSDNPFDEDDDLRKEEEGNGDELDKDKKMSVLSQMQPTTEADGIGKESEGSDTHSSSVQAQQDMNEEERVIIEEQRPIVAVGSRNADELSDESQPADTDPHQKGSDKPLGEESDETKKISATSQLHPTNEAAGIKSIRGEKSEKSDAHLSLVPTHQDKTDPVDKFLNRCPRCNSKLARSCKISPAPLYCRWKVVSVDEKRSPVAKVQSRTVNRCIGCGWDGSSNPKFYEDDGFSGTKSSQNDDEGAHVSNDEIGELSRSSAARSVSVSSGDESSAERNACSDQIDTTMDEKHPSSSSFDDAVIGAVLSIDTSDEQATASGHAEVKTHDSGTEGSKENDSGSASESSAGTSSDERGGDENGSAQDMLPMNEAPPSAQGELSETEVANGSAGEECDAFVFLDMDKQLIMEQTIIMSQLRGENAEADPLENSEMIEAGRDTLEELRLGSCGIGLRNRPVGKEPVGSTHDSEATSSTPRRHNRKPTPGCLYEGKYDKDGLYHDRKGEMMWENGDRYVGRFEHGIRQGVGKLFFADGSVYDGWWRQNQMHGHGTKTSPDGSVYVGNFAFDQRNGRGQYMFANGDSYVGDFKDDEMDGKGLYYFHNKEGQNETFEGVFRAGRRQGWGKYHWADGKVDIIGYRDDERVGMGVRFSVDRKKMWKLEGTKKRGRVNFKRAKEIMSSAQQATL